MYTYKFTQNSTDVQYGPNCHNYATACAKAQEFVDELLKSGWLVPSALNDFINEPYDFILKKNNIIGRLVIGKIIN